MNSNRESKFYRSVEGTPSCTDDEEDTSASGYGTTLHNAVADPRTRTVRVLADRCTTCVFHPGNRAHLAPGRLKELLAKIRAEQGHLVCHSTLGTERPAICRGFADSPDAVISMALRVAAAIGSVEYIEPPELH